MVSMKRIIKLIKEVLFMICGYDDAHCKHEIYSKKEMVELLNKKSQVGHTHAWSEITGKPTTFTPSSHTHDDRYFTESEINSKLATYKLKGDFAVVSGTINLTSGVGNVSIAYPSGFNRNNTVIISVGVAFNSSTVIAYNSNGGALFAVAPIDNSITLNVSNTSGGPNGARSFKVVLMKV